MVVECELRASVFASSRLQIVHYSCVMIQEWSVKSNGKKRMQ